ncbi:SH3 domain-containing protein [Streptacidiphilus neutrinimicus]|uniref:SH3 domain-containing protein n=1 Tax=Streptacidiphilus neutrinimicus TaxID=105420 RepID=UPI0005A5D37F|nr:SH3 domain-containing protein [Streptacidiphilus neutrinimicus]
MNPSLPRTLAAVATAGAALLAVAAPATASNHTDRVQGAAALHQVAAHTATRDCDLVWSTTSALRIRKGPGTGYATIGQLSYHTKGDISWFVNEAHDETWWKIRTLQRSAYGLPAGTVGWVSADYMDYISGCNHWL